jgi:hypothetical protein
MYYCSSKKVDEVVMDDAESRRPTERQPNKVHDGPCSQQFDAVENCAKARGITKHRVRERRSNLLMVVPCGLASLRTYSSS